MSKLLFYLCKKQGCHFTWKNLEFDNLGKNNLEKPGILTFSVVKLGFDSKNLSYKF